MVFIIVEKLIGFLYGCDELLVIENTLRFFLSVYAFKQLLHLKQHATLTACWDLHVKNFFSER
jgi:hypothetical protein